MMLDLLRGPRSFGNSTTGMGSRILDHDWSASPLGEVAAWPQALKTLLGVMLGANQPMFVTWGPEQILLYNDAYAAILAERHPAALGRRYLEVWPEVRSPVQAMLTTAYAGQPVHVTDMRVVLQRPAGPEERFFAFSYTPVFGAEGEVEGVFCTCTDATARVAAERRLQAEAARQLRLFEQAPGLIAIGRGPELRFEFVNRAYRELFGERDYIGRTVEEAFPETERAFVDLPRQVYQSGERASVRHARVLVRRGPDEVEELFLDFIFEPLSDEDGQVTGVMFEGHDVSEAHRAQQALRASQERFRTALAIDTVGAIFFRLDGTIIDANDAFLRMSGYSADDLRAGELTLQKLTPPNWMARSIEAFEELKRKGETTPFEKEYLRKDGTRSWALFAAKRLPDGTGFEFVLDTAARRATEAALRESEEDYRHAAELNPQVAWSARPDGQLDRVAARWREWTGASGLGSSYALGLHPDDVQRTADAWAHSVATGEPYDIIHRVRRVSGEDRWARSRAMPRRDADGRIVRWYGSTEDIHEQQTAEDHLKLMVLELNHRVKNNLATVQSIAVQTLRGAESPAEAREAFLQRISALAAAHDILTREQWEGVGVADIGRGVLDPLIGVRESVRYDGPHVRLTPKAALALSMAFHELGTNALKYGSLTRPEGGVDVCWSVAAGGPDRLRLTWREHGGPPVAPPTRRGFGSRLLERGLAAELNGTVVLTFAASGLVCEIDAPLAPA